MKIGISGASGHLGKAILQQLAARGGAHALVGISRTPSGLPAGVEGRSGDYDQPASLDSAYAGLDRLLLIPSANLRHGVRGAQMLAAIDAARAADVAHVVLVSAAGTREETTALGGAYWAAEQHLIHHVRHWTILRMNYYAEAIADEIQMSLAIGGLTGLGDEKVAYVSRDDLAAAAAGLLLSEGHAGAIYNGTGPAIVSGAQRAAIVSELLGKPVGYAVITPEQLQQGLCKRVCRILWPMP